MLTKENLLFNFLNFFNSFKSTDFFIVHCQVYDLPLVVHLLLLLMIHHFHRSYFFSLLTIGRYTVVREMEEENQVDVEEIQYHRWQVKSPEIVEIVEESKNILSSRNGQTNDVYVAVGKNDLHVVQWVLENAVSPGTQVFLVHVFPPITYIHTPGTFKTFANSDVCCKLSIMNVCAYVIQYMEIKGLDYVYATFTWSLLNFLPPYFWFT